MRNMCGLFDTIFYNIIDSSDFEELWPLNKTFPAFKWEMLSLASYILVHILYNILHYNWFIYSYICTFINLLKKFKLYLFYNDYETSSTTYIKYARWHRCLRSDCLHVGGNRSARRKPTCLTWWPPHMPTPGIEPGSQHGTGENLVNTKTD